MEEFTGLNVNVLLWVVDLVAYLINTSNESKSNRIALSIDEIIVENENLQRNKYNFTIDTLTMS